MTEAIQKNQEKVEMSKVNPMRNIYVEKITLNIGTGKDQTQLEKALKLIKHLTGKEGVKTLASKRIPSWGVRPGLPVGCKLTIRGNEKYELIKKFLKGKENVLGSKNFSENGTVAFGIHEYIDLTDYKYDPDIGIMGFQICIKLSRAGMRVPRRRIRPAKVNVNHIITKQESIDYMKKEFAVKLKGEE